MRREYSERRQISATINIVNFTTRSELSKPAMSSSQLFSKPAIAERQKAMYGDKLQSIKNNMNLLDYRLVREVM